MRRFERFERFWRAAGSEPGGRDRDDEALRGFGFLVPRTENLRTLGTVWNSALFPPSACFGKLAAIGKPADDDAPAAFAQRGASRVFSAAPPTLAFAGRATMKSQRSCRRSFRASWAYPGVPPRFMWRAGDAPYRNTTSGMRGWSRIFANVRETPGIFLAGNYLAGASLGACVEQAGKIAASVALLVPATS